MFDCVQLDVLCLNCMHYCDELSLVFEQYNTCMSLALNYKTLSLALSDL